MDDADETAESALVSADATFSEAREILTAPGTPAEVQRGITLATQASAQGCADATAMLALFEAMGVARPQRWDRAFDLLLLAAQQGSAEARRQMILLAEPSAPWERIQQADGEDWEALRSRISLEPLLAHGEREPLCENPRIRTIAGFLTRSECRWLIERARPRLTRATVLKKTGEHGVAEGRSNSGTAFQVVDMDVVLEVVRTRISAATRIPPPLFEPTQVLHYSVGEEFRPHHDFIDPSNEAYREQLFAGQRIATFLVYLNEEFEGGETDFPAAGVRFAGKTGDALFWANLDRQNRPDPLTLHAGLAPTAGEKWVLSQWIRDRSPGGGSGH